MTALRAIARPAGHIAAAVLTALAVTTSIAPAAAAATDDSPHVIAEPPEVFIPEGRSGTFNVRLSHPPSGMVYVFMRSTGTGTWAAPPVLLTFSPSDWSTPKWYNVWSPQDADAVDDYTTITLSVTGYLPDTVTLRQVDDD